MSTYFEYTVVAQRPAGLFVVVLEIRITLWTLKEVSNHRIVLRSSCPVPNTGNGVHVLAVGEHRCWSPCPNHFIHAAKNSSTAAVCGRPNCSKEPRSREVSHSLAKLCSGGEKNVRNATSFIRQCSYGDYKNMQGALRGVPPELFGKKLHCTRTEAQAPQRSGKLYFS